eukprot:188344_1
MSVSLSITLIYTLLSTTKAYHLSLHSLEWQNASNYCQSYCKSTLASVHSREDHLTTLDIINRNPSVYTRVWTGLNDIKFSDSWEWSDGSLFDFGHIKDTTTGKVIRGTYPWRSDEPDYNDTDQCVALEVGWLYPGYTSGRWIDRKQTANYHFLCNDCSSRIHKYAVVNGGRNVTAAESICQSRFGTSLASVHSHTDMQEAMASCEQITSSNGCWLGLTDAAQHRVYQWTDGTPWDYGRDFHEYPWYKSEPGSTQDQKCIFLDPRNGADEGTYRWDDYWCNSKLPRALCNAPSEICYPGQFFIPKGSPIDWTWTTKPCGVSKSKLIRQSIALLGNKQYLNTDGRLVVDMMYSIPVVGLDGNAGLAFYFDETQCDHYYYVGIWAAHSLIFLGKQTGNQDTLDWATIKYNSINPTYTLGQHYTLRVELTNGVDWKVYLNDALALTVTDDHFNNINNKLSGYIAIRSTYSAIDVKSLYISGEAQYFDDNSWFLQCTDSPTSAPTQPTLMPTADPTLEPTTPIPSHAPTVSPSGAPTTPTAPPTTAAPSIPPTTGEPTVSPTYFPTIEPTVVPSVAPTVDPTIDPTISPTLESQSPSTDPTPSPTKTTKSPTDKPSQLRISSTEYKADDPRKDEEERVERTLPPAVIKDPNDEQELEENASNSPMIWIIGIPIALVTTCFFGIFLLYRFWNENKADYGKRNKNSHVRSPSVSKGSDDGDAHLGDGMIITPRGDALHQMEPGSPMPMVGDFDIITPRKETLGIDMDESDEVLIIPGTPNGIDDESGALMDPQNTDDPSQNKGEGSETSQSHRGHEIMLVGVPKKSVDEEMDDAENVNRYSMSSSSSRKPLQVNYRLQQKYRSNV